MTNDLIDRARTGDAPAAADLAFALMQGDAARFKAGYTFANALLAACEAAGQSANVFFTARVAEELHRRLADAGVAP